MRPLHDEVPPDESRTISAGNVLSFWATSAAVFALLAFWHLVHAFFHFGIISNASHLARLKKSDGRSPLVLANHLCSVANAVVCCAVALPLYYENIKGAGSLGVLVPLWNRPLAMTPLVASSTFYLSLAAYCTHAFIWGLDTAVGLADQLALAQHAVLALLACGMCMVNFVPEICLAMLMLEVPSPFLALSRVLVDFRARSDCFFAATGIVLLSAIVKLRVLLFGACIFCTIGHPDIGQLNGARYFILLLCLIVYVLYVTHLMKIAGELQRLIAKFSWYTEARVPPLNAAQSVDAFGSD